MNIQLGLVLLALDIIKHILNNGGTLMVYITITLLIWGFILNLYRVAVVYNYLNKNNTVNKEKKEPFSNKIYILIPLLDEQLIIERTYNYYKELVKKEPKINVYFITTSKDKLYPSTKMKLDELLRKDKNDSDRIANVHYTGNGIMAHQLNYAIKQIPNDNCIIGIYNADSMIDFECLKYINSFYKDKRNKSKIVQQVCYFDNYQDKPSIINSAINWQNRWSISFELSRYILYKNQHKNKNFIRQFQYVIGHGLFFNKTVFDKIGPFTEKFLNEDNHYGYKIMMNELDIHPIPFLERGEFVQNIREYINQQSVWFNGPLYAFLYYREYFKDSISSKGRIKGFVYSVKNFWHALNWALLPLLSFYSVIELICYGKFKLLLLLLICIFSYVTVINKLSLNIITKFSNFNCKNKNSNIITDIIFFLVHALGPIKTVIKILLNINTQDKKYRTLKRGS